MLENDVDAMEVPEEYRALPREPRRQGREEFLARYTAERNYNGLMDIYCRAKEISRSTPAASTFLFINELERSSSKEVSFVSNTVSFQIERKR